MTEHYKMHESKSACKFFSENHTKCVSFLSAIAKVYNNLL